MNDQALARLMFRTACPNNEILYDEGGRPSVMVFIPKFRMNQVITNGTDRVHPAFIVNGKERDGFTFPSIRTPKWTASAALSP